MKSTKNTTVIWICINRKAEGEQKSREIVGSISVLGQLGIKE